VVCDTPKVRAIAVANVPEREVPNGEKKISVVALWHYSITAAWQPKKGNTVLLTHPDLSNT
jgi:hypothetical protein